MEDGDEKGGGDVILRDVHYTIKCQYMERARNLRATCIQISITAYSLVVLPLDLFVEVICKGFRANGLLDSLATVTLYICMSYSMSYSGYCVSRKLPRQPRPQ